MYCGDNKVHMYKDTTINGNLDVGVGATQTNITTHFNQSGNTGYMQMKSRTRDTGFIHFETNLSYGELFLTVRNTVL